MSTALRVGPLPRPIDEMLAAIDVEIAAVRSKSQTRFVTITDGVRVRRAGPGATYRFACATGVRLRVDERVVCSFDGTRVDGWVTSCAGFQVTVSLAADLGPRLPHGRLVVDRTFLWRALKERLSALRSEHRSLDASVVDMLTGIAPIRVATRAPVQAAVATEGLNAEQVRALEQALGSSLTLIFGPPGTGKTFTLERIVVDGFHAAGESVLYTGPTNKAVDLGLRRILERLRQLGELDEAVSAGRIVRVGPISDPQLDADFGSRVSLDALVEARELELMDEVARLADRRGGLLDADPPGPGTSGPQKSAEPRNRQLEIERIDRRISELAQQAKGARRHILQRALIVFTTAHRAMLPDQVERTFDAVVLDEAGATALPVACCAAARAVRHVVCAGDPYQLGAVHASSDAAVVRWIGRDVFHASGALAALQQHGRASGVVALTTQHRFDASIARLANHVTYKQTPLVTHAGLMRRPPSPSPWGSDSILLLDTSALRPFVLPGLDGDSRWNPVHVSIVRWVLRELHRAGGIPRRRDDPESVTVLTPYREQRRRLSGHLPAPLRARGISAHTVHTYQGDECGTVVLDMVDTRGLAKSPFLQATTRTCTLSRLNNVAATRARRRLIVISNVKHILRTAPRGPVREFVDYLQKHATRIHLPLDLAHKALAFVHEWEQRGGR